MKVQLCVLFALVLSADAECPNSCSGHGNCNDQQQCECYLEGKVLNQDGNVATDGRLAQWTGADCSEMTCPRGISWTKASGTQDHQHGAECSDIGVCNRLTGQCACHPGFGGIACARTECPNSCNGHGMCRSNKQFAEKYARAMSTAVNLNYFLPQCKDAVSATQYEEQNCERAVEHLDNYFNTFMSTYDDAWDSNLQWGCDCDAGFFGADCSLRECPSTDDPLDEVCIGLLQDVEDLTVTDTTDDSTIILSTTDATETAVTYGQAYADYLAQFQESQFLASATGDYFASFSHFPDMARAMHPGNFPTGAGSDSDELEAAVTAGNYILTITPDQVNYKNAFETIAVRTMYCAGRQAGQECSGRGICDHATGLCSCFEGYMSEDCGEPEELV